MVTVSDERAFEVSWSDRDLDPFRTAFANYVWPRLIPGSGWKYGCDPEFLQRFCRYVCTSYDISNAVADLNRYPQFVLSIEPEVDLHIVHIRSGRRDAIPLLMLHGWPGSPFEFWPALELLAAPDRDGPPLDFVIASLPGYGFSGPLARPVGPKTTARWLHTLMHDRLGYEQYLVQGTDWGVVIAPWLAHQHPDAVRAIHLDNFAVISSAGDPTSTDEQDWQRRRTERDVTLGGYHRLQTTRPQSLAYAMTDNPVAQSAWLLERFHDWSDLDGTDLDEVWGLDRLATSVLIYLLTGTFTTSTWMYLGAALEPAAQLPAALHVPTGYCAWPEPHSAQPSRAVVAQHYNLIHWNEPSRGGHFAPTEQPAEFSRDIVAWINALVS